MHFSLILMLSNSIYQFTRANGNLDARKRYMLIIVKCIISDQESSIDGAALPYLNNRNRCQNFVLLD